MCLVGHPRSLSLTADSLVDNLFVRLSCCRDRAPLLAAATRGSCSRLMLAAARG